MLCRKSSWKVPPYLSSKPGPKHKHGGSVLLCRSAKRVKLPRRKYKESDKKQSRKLSTPSRFCNAQLKLVEQDFDTGKSYIHALDKQFRAMRKNLKAAMRDCCNNHGTNEAPEIANMVPISDTAENGSEIVPRPPDQSSLDALDQEEGSSTVGPIQKILPKISEANAENKEIERRRDMRNCNFRDYGRGQQYGRWLYSRQYPYYDNFNDYDLEGDFGYGRRGYYNEYYGQRGYGSSFYDPYYAGEYDRRPHGYMWMSHKIKDNPRYGDDIIRCKRTVKPYNQEPFRYDSSDSYRSDFLQYGVSDLLKPYRPRTESKLYKNTRKNGKYRDNQGQDRRKNQREQFRRNRPEDRRKNRRYASPVDRSRRTDPDYYRYREERRLGPGRRHNRRGDRFRNQAFHEVSDERYDGQHLDDGDICVYEGYHSYDAPSYDRDSDRNADYNSEFDYMSDDGEKYNMSYRPDKYKSSRAGNRFGSKLGKRCSNVHYIPYRRRYGRYGGHGCYYGGIMHYDTSDYDTDSLFGYSSSDTSSCLYSDVGRRRRRYGRGCFNGRRYFVRYEGNRGKQKRGKALEQSLDINDKLSKTLEDNSSTSVKCRPISSNCEPLAT